MTEHLKHAFALAKAQNRPAFVPFVTAGFPTDADTVPAMLALQAGGADMIELGVPFSDPVADGPTLQEASFVSLQHGTDMPKCLSYASQARSQGLSIPIILMGYYNPFLSYGEHKLMQHCKDAGVNGFIVVDLPPEEAVRFRYLCTHHGLSYVPLVAPSTSDTRIKKLVQCADAFVYVVSTLGVTGARASVSSGIAALVKRVKAHTHLPLAVGFGVCDRDQFLHVAQYAEAVVIGSRLVSAMKNADAATRAECVRQFAYAITQRSVDAATAAQSAFPTPASKTTTTTPPPPHHDDPQTADTQSTDPTHAIVPRFGEYGGQYAPEALVDCLDEIEQAFKTCMTDPTFWDEFKSHYTYMGRPSPLHLAERLTTDCGGARIWLKREDLNHTGSHKINNAMGQVLLARRIGKKRIIAETGAGQHGVATATVCAKFGLECVIYMGAADVQRQALNVFRIKLLGATVVPVTSGSQTLKDAVNEALRDWVTNVDTTHYLIGSAIGPHPFPTIVRELQSVIGRETREQLHKHVGKLPDAVVACVGGGSNAIGMFYPFINDTSVKIVGVEAGGDGICSGRHSATLTAGRPGVLHGTRTYVIQDANGQIVETHSISAGLDYPGVGPEHAWLKDTHRATYVAATDAEALDGLRKIAQMEGILPALESAHAIAKALEIAKTMPMGSDIVVCVSGRGDKDVHSIAEALPKLGPAIGWDLRFEA